MLVLVLVDTLREERVVPVVFPVFGGLSFELFGVGVAVISLEV